MLLLQSASIFKKLPPEPSHFEIYPSVLAKTAKMRLIHKQIIANIESPRFLRDAKEEEAFIYEKS